MMRGALVAATIALIGPSATAAVSRPTKATVAKKKAAKKPAAHPDRG